MIGPIIWNPPQTTGTVTTLPASPATAETLDLGARDEIEVRVELRSGDAGPLLSRLPDALQAALRLHARVDAVPVGTLPRFPVKARRFTDHRTPATR